MVHVRKRDCKGALPPLQGTTRSTDRHKSVGARGRCIPPVHAGLATVLGFSALLLLASCGVKAPPQPREVVVPAPVTDLTVTSLPEGLRIAFTLPSKSLDGSALETIGGYRILREGPKGRDVRQDIRFSVSETRQKVGKPVTFLDEPPSQGGTYRYCAVPFDVYGTYAGRRRLEAFCWEGTLSGKGDR